MTERLTTGAEVQLTVNVDHGQFIACDAGAMLDIDSYSEHATRDGLALWSDGSGMTVFTASHWTSTVVTVALSSTRPTVDDAAWDHIVEGGLILRNGLRIYGPEDTGVDERSISLPPGTFSLLVCGRDFDSTDDHGDDGSDSYALFLWPGSPLARCVLKDGFTWMDRVDETP